MVKKFKREELIDIVAKAIADFEGFTSGKSRIAVQNANPGNVRIWRYADRRPYPRRNGYVDFVTWAGGDYQKGLEEGWRVLKVLVGKYIDGNYTGSKPPSFYKMFEKYAPYSDQNHPDKYAEFVAARVGVPANTVIKSLIEEE